MSAPHERDENLIALSAEFHTHPRFATFRETCAARRLNGSTGIYDLIRDMGIALTDWESEQSDPWEHHDWMLLTEHYPAKIIAAALDKGEHPQAPHVLRKCLTAAIKASRFKLF
jgi:hypothetical protein